MLLATSSGTGGGQADTLQNSISQLIIIMLAPHWSLADWSLKLCLCECVALAEG